MLALRSRIIYICIYTHTHINTLWEFWSSKREKEYDISSNIKFLVMKYVVQVHNPCKYAVCHFLHYYYETSSKKNLVSSNSVTILWHGYLVLWDGYFVQRVIQVKSGRNSIRFKKEWKESIWQSKWKTRRHFTLCLDEQWQNYFWSDMILVWMIL